MAARQPIDLVIAKGKKHLTKEEIAERKATEVRPFTDNVKAPKYLTKDQRKHFNDLAEKLLKINILGETDVDTLARYVVAELEYQAAVASIQQLNRSRPDDPYDDDYLKQLETWSSLLEAADRRQERYYKQASSLARDLGLTISSRCKLQVPVKEEEVKVNRFAKFGITGEEVPS